MRTWFLLLAHESSYIDPTTSQCKYSFSNHPIHVLHVGICIVYICNVYNMIVVFNFQAHKILL